MLILGPVIFGLILGFVVGIQIKTNSKQETKFTLASFVAIIIAGLLMAWQLGAYPFYTDVPIATGFIFALIGVLIGKLVSSAGEAWLGVVMMFLSTNKCDGSGDCIKQCPTKAIRYIGGKAFSCLTCGKCYEACPNDAIFKNNHNLSKSIFFIYF